MPALVLTAVLDLAGIAVFGTGGIYGGPTGQELIFKDLGNRLTIDAFVRNLFFLQTITGPTFGSNGPLWTLSYEFWYYTAFPFLAVSCWPDTKIHIRAVCFLILGAIGLFTGWDIALNFSYWMMGCILELIPKRLDEKVACKLAFVTGVAFVGLCVLLVRYKLPNILSDAIEAAAFCVLCFFILYLRSAQKRNMFSKLSNILSEMSYTLYLCHAPVLVFICAMVMQPWSPWSTTPAGLLKFGGVVTVAFLAAFLLYFLFEGNTQKIRSFITKKYQVFWR